MQIGRIVALVGAALGVVGLAMPGATSDGEPLMADLSAALAQQGQEFPDGISTIWGGLATWAQVLVVVALVTVVAVALLPPLKAAPNRYGALTTAVFGVLLLAYAVVKYFEAVDDADTLEEGFAGLAQLGLVPEAFTVSVGVGFFVIFLGTALVAAGGVLEFMGADKGAAEAA